MPLIAGRYATSVRSVERVVKEWKVTGAARCPTQGQGKTSDSRYVFAGPEGRLNLKILEEAEAAGRRDDSITTIRNRYLEMGGGGQPTDSCIAVTLRGPSMLIAKISECLRDTCATAQHRICSMSKATSNMMSSRIMIHVQHVYFRV